jgi:hypothetical protein
MVGAGEKETIRRQDCKEFIKAINELSWNTYDSFKVHATSIWQLKFNEQEWLKSSCTCPGWQKKFICKHVISVAYRLNKVDFPLAAQNVPIGRKRKRGRPMNTRQALNFQPNEAQKS